MTNEHQKAAGDLKLVESKLASVAQDRDRLATHLQVRDEKLDGLCKQLDAAREEAKAWSKEATNFREDVNFLTQQSNMLIDELQTEAKTSKALREELKQRSVLLEEQ